MPKRNLIWIGVIVGAGVVTVLLSRTPLQPNDPDMARFRPVSRAYRVLRQRAYRAPPESRLQQGAVRGMVEQLDEYSSYIEPDRVRSFRARMRGAVLCTGLVVAIDANGLAEVVGALPGSPAHEAGIAPGGRLTAIDGGQVAHLPIEEIRRLIDAPRAKPVEVTIAEPDGQEHTCQLSRRKRQVESVTGVGRAADGRWEYFLGSGRDLACVRVREFLPGTAGEIQQALRELSGLQGLVLDLRDNPGGRLESGFAVANLFLRSGAIFTQVNSKSERSVHEARAGGTWPDVPIVALVNGGTASAAEIVAGSLRLHARAVLVGARTRGEGFVQSMIALPDNMGLANVTTGEFFIGLDVPVARRPGATIWGVEPHVPLPLTASAEQARQRFWLGVDVVGPAGWPADGRSDGARGATEPTTYPATGPARPILPAMSADAQLAGAVRLLESPERMREIFSRPAGWPETSTGPASTDNEDGRDE